MTPRMRCGGYGRAIQRSSAAMAPVVKGAVRIALCAMLSLAIFSCASQSASQSSSPIAPANACKISAKVMCEHLRLHRLSLAEKIGVMQSPRIWFGWINGPSGNPIAEARCEMDIGFRGVLNASIVSGPAITDKDVDYLRQRGLCEAP